MLKLILLSLVEYFGKLALQIGLASLEKKYPGSKEIIDMIIGWLHTKASEGDEQATQVLKDHVVKVCSGSGCPSDLVGE